MSDQPVVRTPFIVAGLMAVLFSFAVASYCEPETQVLPKAPPTPAAPGKPLPTETDSVPASPEKDGGDWVKSVSRSEFDDSKTVVIALRAERPVEGWLTSETPTLVLRCSEDKTKVYFINGMQTASDYPTTGLEESLIRLRYDDRPAKARTASHSTDNEALFVAPAISEIREMLRSEQLLYGFTPFNASPQATRFNLRGLSEHIGELQAACGWSD